MPEISSSDGKKPMEQPGNDLTEAMGQLSVNSDKTSSTKNLSDMPVDVVRLIIERCEYMEQLKLRKVSKSLRELVDKQKPACKSVKVQCYLFESTIHFDDYHVVYTEELDEPDDYDSTGIYVERDDFEEAALDDLASTLKNPKLELEEFSVYFVDGYKESRDLEGYYDKLQCILKSLNRQLSVKRAVFKLPTLSRLLSILPCLQPGVLKRISLDLLFDTDDDLGIDLTGMDQVALLDQWKQAEVLKLYECFDTFPMEYATHFKRFIIVEYIFDADKIARIRDYLSKLQNFEQCTLSSLSFHANVHQVLGEPVSSNAMEEVFHHPIPDSNCFLEFTKPINGCEVKIEKKKREVY
ncbi:hypothetical protein CAEBREN_23871 [Caenorhabditis brenneri]|uniref:F-box domain-containing protein n=1 Tax=Caenorhabditis brenneri TaxID=135651 RepID=G0N312_CAEBE|nr:hypothetical protein CAEBREN_23871 [Caenorhabditis brenneri]